MVGIHLDVVSVNVLKRSEWMKMMADFPTEDEFAKHIADKALDECFIEGVSLRNWITVAGDYAAIQAGIYDAIEEMTLLERHKLRLISYDQELAIGMCIDILKKHINTVVEPRKDDDN